MKLYNYLSNINNWCQPEQIVFYKIYLLYIVTTAWIMIGMYCHDQELLKIIFWPFHYGPFGH